MASSPSALQGARTGHAHATGDQHLDLGPRGSGKLLRSDRSSSQGKRAGRSGVKGDARERVKEVAHKEHRACSSLLARVTAVVASVLRFTGSLLEQSAPAYLAS